MHLRVTAQTVFYAVFCVVVAPALGGSAVRIDDFTTEDRLPQNTVTSVQQTPDGYLWIGTQSGLARFDGREFASFFDELTVAETDDANCEELIVDHDGQLWVRTKRAVVCYDAERQFRSYTLPGGLVERVKTMSPARRGGVWLGAPRELVHFKDGAIIERFDGSNSLINFPIETIVEDFEGRLWLGGYDGDWVWRRFDPTTQKRESLAAVTGLADVEVVSVLVEGSGALWLAAAGELIYWDGLKAVRYPHPAAIGRSPLTRLCRDIKGRIWALQFSPGRVVRFERDRGEFNAYGPSDGLTDADIRCLFPDREGSIWIGTGSGGLNQMVLLPFSTVLSTNAQGRKNEVFSIAPGRQGRIWFGESSGLTVYDNGRFTTFTNTTKNWHHQYSHGTRSVSEDHAGAIWFGVDREGLQVLEHGEFRRVLGPGVERGESWSINSLYEDLDGRLWVGSPTGLFCRENGQFKQYTVRDGLADDYVIGILQAPDGALWIGSYSGGLHRFQDGQFRVYTVKDGLLANQIAPLVVEADGTVWAGTQKGLNRIRGNQIDSVTPQHGLHHHEAGALVDDQRGYYWSHGNAGIWRAKKSELHAVADGRTNQLHYLFYGEADGLLSSECNPGWQPSVAQTADGRLWFPTTHGAVVVHPDELVSDQVPPPVVLRQIVANDEIVYQETRRFDQPLTSTAAEWESVSAGLAHLRFGAGRARVLKIRFGANSFISPEKVRLQYKLHGSDAQWHDDEGGRMALYPNLPPGDYRFHVRARNSHGAWNDAGQLVSFTIAPHFYQTRWFYGLCAAGLIGAAYGIHRIRLGVVRKFDRLRQQHMLELERTRIAQDMHDDLGSNLTKIAILSEVARKNLKQPQVAEVQVEQISATARTAVDNITEIIWAINPGNDTLDNLCSYLRSHAAQAFELASIHAELHFPEIVPSQSISAELRRNLFLAVKEVLHNILKHAGATRAELRLTLEGYGESPTLPDERQPPARLNATGAEPSRKCRTETIRKGLSDAPRIEIVVQDNGRGFDVNGVGQFRNGLRNMRQRIAECGGDIEVKSALGHGTEIRIAVPLIG